MSFDIQSVQVIAPSGDFERSKMKTIDYLDALKSEKNFKSDSELSVALGLTRSAISCARVGKSVIGDETAMTVAEMLHIDPAPLLALAHAERSRDEKIRAVWSKIAAAMSAGGFVVSSGQNKQAENAISRAATPSPASGVADSIYIMSTNALRRLAQFLPVVPLHANYA